MDKVLNRHFSKEDIQMAKEHVKISSIIRYANLNHIEITSHTKISKSKNSNTKC